MHIITGILQPTPISCLPVLSNIAPPHIDHRWLEKLCASPSLPLDTDVFSHPKHDLHQGIHCGLNCQTGMCQQQPDGMMSGQFVADPTVWPPGFDLPCHLWALLNRFRIGQRTCTASLYTWDLCDDPLCHCGLRQSMAHVVDEFRWLDFMVALGPFIVLMKLQRCRCGAPWVSCM